MCFRSASIFALSIAAVSVGSFPAVAQMSDEEIVKNATSAAPEAVAKDAAVVAMNEKMEMRTVREGKNNFTCMPDNPMSPGNDPMCLDEGGMQWAAAWISKQQPPAGMVGFGYMLMGGSDASNIDPHAEMPAAGAQWVDTGPHVMIFNVGEAGKSYPRQGENPDTKAPYVMWSGTPYEHLMIPVE
jgi:hypothetical protein